LGATNIELLAPFVIYNALPYDVTLNLENKNNIKE